MATGLGSASAVSPPRVIGALGRVVGRASNLEELDANVAPTFQVRFFSGYHSAARPDDVGGDLDHGVEAGRSRSRVTYTPAADNRRVFPDDIVIQRSPAHALVIVPHSEDGEQRGLLLCVQRPC